MTRHSTLSVLLFGKYFISFTHFGTHTTNCIGVPHLSLHTNVQIEKGSWSAKECEIYLEFWTF